MNRKLAIFLLALITLDFAVLSGYALMQHGYWGLFEHQFTSSAGWQVLADLVIVCLLAMVWMVVGLFIYFLYSKKNSNLRKGINNRSVDHLLLCACKLFDLLYASNF